MGDAETSEWWEGRWQGRQWRYPCIETFLLKALLRGGGNGACPRMRRDFFVGKRKEGVTSMVRRLKGFKLGGLSHPSQLGLPNVGPPASPSV